LIYALSSGATVSLFSGLKLSHMGLKNACYRIFVSSPYDVALRQWEKQKSADR